MLFRGFKIYRIIYHNNNSLSSVWWQYRGGSITYLKLKIGQKIQNMGILDSYVKIENWEKNEGDKLFSLYFGFDEKNKKIKFFKFTTFEGSNVLSIGDDSFHEDVLTQCITLKSYLQPGSLLFCWRSKLNI